MENKKLFKKQGNESTLRNGMNSNGPKKKLGWKEWKQQKKEDRKKWDEQKIQKKKSSQVESIKDTEEEVPDLSKIRDFTVSLGVPGSILDNAQSPELKTYLAGQIARAAAVFKVNEIIVFSETPLENLEESEKLILHKKKGCFQLSRILQFLECPQYLRKFFFPLHKDLEHAGLLNPLNIPAHLSIDEESQYREGVVLNKPAKEGRGSYVYIGLEKNAIIDKVLEPYVRVTVKLDKEQHRKKTLKGKAVSPNAPSKEKGIYCGYSIRFAQGLQAVLQEGPYKYDVTVGTSDKGTHHAELQLTPNFKHLLVVFGGLRGLEGCLEADESIMAEDPRELFHHYINTCPDQGSRTIRTEEAVLITLSVLTSKFPTKEISS